MPLLQRTVDDIWDSVMNLSPQIQFFFKLKEVSKDAECHVSSYSWNNLSIYCKYKLKFTIYKFV